MGFDELKKNVLENAKKEADLIIKNAYKESDEAKRKLELEIESLEEKSKQEINIFSEQFEKKEVASANLESKKRLLQEKKKLIEIVFENVKNELKNELTKKDRKAIIENLVKKAKKEINIKIVYCNKQDSELISEKVKIEIKKDMVGGIIAEDKSGEIIVDYSFETIIADMKDKYSAEVSQILFD
jgi:V/A-type H+/Na+-transporting ATPase subunit E